MHRESDKEERKRQTGDEEDADDGDPEVGPELGPFIQPDVVPVFVERSNASRGCPHFTLLHLLTAEHVAFFQQFVAKLDNVCFSHHLGQAFGPILRSLHERHQTIAFKEENVLVPLIH
jgi:hypothetical protein